MRERRLRPCEIQTDIYLPERLGGESLPIGIVPGCEDRAHLDARIGCGPRNLLPILPYPIKAMRMTVSGTPLTISPPLASAQGLCREAYRFFAGSKVRATRRVGSPNLCFFPTSHRMVTESEGA